MNKEKFYKWIKVSNIIAVGIFFPIMIMFFTYALGSIQDEGFLNPLAIAAIGYLCSLVFGLLAFKRNYFLVLSLIGWLIFGIGNNFDAKKTKEGNNNACIELRRDQNCIEDEKGSINCKTGKHAGVYARICEGIKK